MKKSLSFESGTKKCDANQRNKVWWLRRACYQYSWQCHIIPTCTINERKVYTFTKQSRYFFGDRSGQKLAAEYWKRTQNQCNHTSTQPTKMAWNPIVIQIYQCYCHNAYVICLRNYSLIIYILLWELIKFSCLTSLGLPNMIRLRANYFIFVKCLDVGDDVISIVLYFSKAFCQSLAHGSAG